MNRLFLLPLIMAATLVSPYGAAAQDYRAPHVTVVGEGESAIPPDMAIVNLAVMREAETARGALDENNAAMQDVIAAMKEADVEPRDLQTAGLRIEPRYVYPRNGGDEAPRIVGYQVTNTLTVRVRDLAKLGEIIDRSVTLGVNQGGGISFVNDDPGAAMAEARTLAVEDALARARALAEAAGAELGRILEISERAPVHPPMPFDGRAMRMEAADASVPIETGENAYRVQVSVTFELNQ